MKKILIGTVAAAGCMLLTPNVAGAAYPPAEQGPIFAGLVTPPAPQAPAPTVLPAAGSSTQMMLQVGLVTVVAGGALVGTSMRRRSRSTS
jgi:hypothetical protein